MAFFFNLLYFAPLRWFSTIYRWYKWTPIWLLQALVHCLDVQESNIHPKKMLFSLPISFYLYNIKNVLFIYLTVCRYFRKEIMNPSLILRSNRRVYIQARPGPANHRYHKIIMLQYCFRIIHFYYFELPATIQHT